MDLDSCSVGVFINTRSREICHAGAAGAACRREQKRRRRREGDGRVHVTLAVRFIGRIFELWLADFVMMMKLKLKEKFIVV